MKKFLFGVLALFTVISIHAQKIVTEPVFPVANKPIIIYFHSNLETGTLKNYTAPLYAHTGVNFSDGSKWNNVIVPWGNNITQPMFEYVGSYTYKLTISPDIYTFYSVALSKTISQIALVIRSADATKQTADLFLDIYAEGLNVNFAEPAKQNNLVELNQSVPVTVNANLSDSIKLYRNGLFIAKTSTSQVLSYSFTAEEYGENMVVVKAFASTETVADTFYYFVRPAPVSESLPDGIKDGINYLSDTSAILCLYAPFKNYAFALGDFSGWAPDSSSYMKRTPDGLRYWLQLNGLVPGKEYAYQYFVDGSILIGDPYADKILDFWNDPWISNSTYPNLKPYPKDLTTGIVSVLQTAQTPYVWKHSNYTPPAKETAVIYELLVRDFIAAHDWKTLTDTLNYFSKLGVSALEIMPFNEFEGNESWGYNPSYYFAPDKYYGPKNDLKAFVDSCHSRGIAVIMDMVLNHSFGQSPLVQLYWNSALNRPAANNPWYNEVSPNTTYFWGNDFNHESQDTKDFVDRVTGYWMTEYGIDGYRFDFSKGFTNKAGDGWAYDASRIALLKRIADQIWAVNPNAYIILEHFADNSEETVLANYGMMIWGNMNARYNEATMGWNEAGKSDITSVSYKSRGWSLPNLVGYMESHDEERLMYKNRMWGNSSGSMDIKQVPVGLKRVELAAAFFITVPGPKMIWQFEELGYDTSINYAGRIGNKPILWNYLSERPRINPVFSKLIHLKTDEPAFSTTNFTMSVATAVKRIELNHADMDVRIIGNFDVVSQPANPNFSHTGLWYEYLSGEVLDVTNVTAAITLQAGEYRIYTTKMLVTPELPTSLKKDEATNGNVLVFPNPVNDILHVEGNAAIKQIRILDIGGRIIKTIQTNQISSEIDFSGLDKGIYLLEMQSGEGRVVKRVVRR